jgi:transposase
MDKAGWHIAGDLVVPDNISLVFLPPYAPELNPIERLWLRARQFAIVKELLTASELGTS